MNFLVSEQQREYYSLVKKDCGTYATIKVICADVKEGAITLAKRVGSVAIAALKSLSGLDFLKGFAAGCGLTMLFFATSAQMRRSFIHSPSMHTAFAVIAGIYFGAINICRVSHNDSVKENLESFKRMIADNKEKLSKAFSKAQNDLNDLNEGPASLAKAIKPSEAEITKERDTHLNKIELFTTTTKEKLVEIEGKIKQLESEAQNLDSFTAETQKQIFLKRFQNLQMECLNITSTKNSLLSLPDPLTKEVKDKLDEMFKQHLDVSYLTNSDLSV